MKRNRPPSNLTLTKLFDSLSQAENSGHSAVQALLTEKRHFLEVTALEYGIGAVHLKAINAGLARFLEDLMQDLPGRSGGQKEEFEALIQKLIDRQQASPVV